MKAKLLTTIIAQYITEETFLRENTTGSGGCFSLSFFEFKWMQVQGTLVYWPVCFYSAQTTSICSLPINSWLPHSSMEQSALK